MASDSTVKVSFLGDASSLKRAADETDGHLSKIANGIGNVAKKAAIGFAAAGVAAGVFAKSAIGAASDLAESQGKVNVVFKDQAKEIDAWASKSATAFGQSKQQALEAVGTYGNLFSAFGIGAKQSATMSKSLVELAADLASFNNTSVDDALLALRSGLSGEAEPLKKFGVALTDDRLKLEAVKLGLIKTTKDGLTPAAKAQASYSLIMKDTALAQGDFARTSDGLANKTRILKAQFSDIQAEIGTKLLPIAVALAGKLLEIANDPRFKAFLVDVQATAARVFGWLKENVPPVLDAIATFIREHVIPALQELGQWVQDKLVPALSKMAASFRDEIWPVLEEKVLPALAKLAIFIKDEVLPILGKIVVFIVAELIPAFFKIVNWISTVLIPKIAEVTVAFWHFVIEVKDVVARIVEAFKDVGEKIWAPFAWAFDKIAWAYEHSIKPIIDAVRGIGDFFGLTGGGGGSGAPGSTQFGTGPGGATVFGGSSGGGGGGGGGAAMVIQNLSVSSLNPRQAAAQFMDEVRRIERGLS